MSANTLFPSMSAEITPEQLCGDIDSNIPIATDWYTPVPYTYDQPYLTPFPSTTMESHQWNQYARASVPGLDTTNFSMAQVSNDFQSMAPCAPERPHSSPSTFGPSPDNLYWATPAGLGIHYSTPATQQAPMAATMSPPDFHAYPSSGLSETPSPAQLHEPQPRRSYQPIAPYPAISAGTKRSREDDDSTYRMNGGISSYSSPNKRKRTLSTATQSLSDDDRYLVHLKQEESLPWKDIAERFGEGSGKVYTAANLQMRYKRLRVKHRVWDDDDVRALRQAYEHWEKKKWDIIKAKMLEFGIDEEWPAKHCERKWQELTATSPVNAAAVRAPASSSPAGAGMAYAWVPRQ